MELKTDSRHKKIDLRELDLEKVKRMGIRLGATSLTLLMLSGCSKKVNNDYSDKIPANTQEVTVDNEEYNDDVSLDNVVIEDKVAKEYNILEHSDNETVNLKFSEYIEFDDNRQINFDFNYTYDDLKHITSITVIVRDEEDANYDYLNYMPNLKNLTIVNLSSDVDKFSNIDGSRFPSGINVSIKSSSDSISFSRERYGFLEDIESIDTLEIGDDDVAVNIDSDFLQSLRQVHNLKLSLGYISNFKYKDLTYLDSLTINGGVYDTSIYFTNEELASLINSGVSVTVDDMEKLRSVNDQLDSIVSNLDIDENSTEQDKINAVLTYVLCQYNYDEEIHNMIERGEDIPNDKIHAFYEDGYMTSGFEGNSQICGNYAAITTALCKRVGLDSFILSSSNHAWNAVQIGDYYYYVDSTWLDGNTIGIMEDDPTEVSYDEEGRKVVSYGFKDIKAEEIFSEKKYNLFENLRWYLVDPTETSEIDNNARESHDLRFTPEGLEIKEIPDDIEDSLSYKTSDVVENNDNVTTEEIEEKEEIRDISKKKFHVDINGKKVVVGAGAFVGVLAALGIGKLVHDDKEKKRRERLRREEERNRRRHDCEMRSMFSDSNNSYGSSYSSSYNGYGGRRY